MRENVGAAPCGRPGQARGGRPIIKGTRIPVSLILNYLADNYSIQELLDHFPHPTPEDIHEALRYGSSVLQK